MPLLKRVLLPVLLFAVASNVCSQSIDSAMYHFNAGRFHRASLEFDNVLPRIVRVFGETDTTVYTLFVLYAAISAENDLQYEKAEGYYLRIKNIYENKNALSAEIYLSSISYLPELYREWGRLEKADSCFTDALEKYRKAKAENTAGYINLLNNAALLYQALGRFDKAEQFFTSSLELSLSLLGENNPKSISIMNNIATLYHKAGRYQKAEAIYIETLEASTKAFGEESPNTVAVLNNLGALYDDMGDYEKAESSYNLSLEIRGRRLGAQHPDYAVAANNLAELYFKMGIYEKAESLYLQASEITGRYYGEEDIRYATSLNNLGALYHNMADYGKAEPLYLQAMGIRKKVLGIKHPGYATSLNNTALLYHEMGNFEKADTMYRQAMMIRKEVLGVYHPDYLVSLNNLALFYLDTGNPDGARDLLQILIDSRRKINGPDHPDYAVSLNNMAMFFFNTGKFSDAEPLYLEALTILKSRVGEMNLDYASTLNNLADLYDSEGNYSKAEDLYLRSMDIIFKVVGDKHPNYASVVSNLALLYQESGQPGKAEEFYRLAMDTYMSQIRRQFSFLSEKEKEKYMARIEFFFNTYKNFIYNQYANNPAISGEGYNIELAGKGLMLFAHKQIRSYVLGSGDENGIETYYRWMAVRASLAKQYSLPVTLRLPDINTLEDQADELEKVLVRIYSSKSGQMGIGTTTWENVRDQLSAGEAAIEFTSFPYFNGNRWSDSTVYVAFILRKNDPHPVMVTLCEERSLDSVFVRGSYSDMTFINMLYRWADTGGEHGRGKGQRLYEHIWKPIEGYLSGISSLYISLSGLLHQLSFAAVPCSETEMVSDRYNIRQQITTSEIGSGSRNIQMKNIILYGGIDYDSPARYHSDTVYWKKKDNILTAPQPDRAGKSVDSRGGYLMYLEGTLKEVEEIRKIAEDAGSGATILSGSEADEASFRNLDGNSGQQIIHVATHGFFFPDDKASMAKTEISAGTDLLTEVFMQSGNPLIRSGLAFAGANLAWGGKAPGEDEDDGIVTAFEVSNLYLPNTILVVLSACETGLGEIRGSEGVFGLQRSFKIAGAGYLLMSLWKVPDYQTTELMTLFYKELFAGKPVDVALSSARNSMKISYPGSPFLWAGFVLLR